MRDDFSEEVKRLLAYRVNHRCSRCGAPTSGPAQTGKGYTNAGVAAHLTAASPGGARYASELTPEGRRDERNGIWLCWSCSWIVDSDPLQFTVPVLRQMRQAAEERAAREMGLAPSALPTSYAASSEHVLSATIERAVALLEGFLELRYVTSATYDEVQPIEVCRRLTDALYRAVRLSAPHVGRDTEAAMLALSKAADLLTVFVSTRPRPDLGDSGLRERAADHSWSNFYEAFEKFNERMRYELEPRDARERRESTARAIREVRVGLEGLAKKLAGYGSVVTSNGPTPVEDREPRYAAVRRLCAEIREAIPRCTPTLSVEKANELKRTMDDIEDHVMPRVKKKVERLAQDPANLHRLSDPAWKNVFKAEGASLHHSASTLLRLAEEIGSLA